MNDSPDTLTMDFTSKIRELEGFITDQAKVQTDVNVQSAISLNLQIKNSEVPSSDISLFSQPKNTEFALAILLS